MDTYGLAPVDSTTLGTSLGPSPDARYLALGQVGRPSVVTAFNSATPLEAWSMLGVNSKPFSPFNRSSFEESRQGLQWLAIK